MSIQSGLIATALLCACTSHPPPTTPADLQALRDIAFHYEPAAGLGREDGVCRRDPSDVIRVGDTCYVYYTRILGRPAGYWGTIWYATSDDEGRTWTERGEALGVGAPGAFDSHAVFTPNVLVHGGRTWLYYTGVRPTPGRTDGVFENNSETDFTAIGVAVADTPDGPFARLSDRPVLTVGADPDRFDSYRVDDAALLVRDGQVWLYYKGRCLADGRGGPSRTKMGLAIAPRPEGPFERQNGGDAILARSHEVLIWPYGPGVAALASISSTIEYAPDGVDFETDPLAAPVERRPQAPGAFRPDLTEPRDGGRGLSWGISLRDPGGNPFLVRFTVTPRSRSE